MHNETNYVRKLDTYRDLEKSEPLPIWVESHKPYDLLRDWFRSTCGRPKLEIREKVFEKRKNFTENTKHFQTYLNKEQL